MGLFEVLLLYVAFRLKHFACDFLLQNVDISLKLFSEDILLSTKWLPIEKEKPGPLGNKALLIHSAIHTGGTFFVTLFFAPAYWWLAIADFFIHISIDKTKGTIKYNNGWTFKDNAFWIAVGLDQEAHNFTHLAYVVIIVSGYGLT